MEDKLRWKVGIFLPFGKSTPQPPALGDSFDPALDELAAIRRDSFSEKYLLVTRDGKEFWLTSNFGNRLRRFVEAIRQLRPDGEYVTK